jgi:hypothetical protein
MTRSSRYTPESPEVASILTGVWKSGVKTYYRVDDDGKHIDVRIREELIAALGISSKLATRLLQQADLPCAPFVCTRAREKAMTAPSDIITMTVETLDDESEIELEDDLVADGDIDLDELEECSVTDHEEPATSSIKGKKGSSASGASGEGGSSSR